MPSRFSGNEPIASPLWAVRGLPWLATLMLAVSVFAGHHEVLRDACAGGALGLLVGFCVYSWQIKSVVLKNTTQPSDVQRYPIS